jgi:uncharacterized protein YutE (UPF0331/DUF86 family)
VIDRDLIAAKLVDLDRRVRRVQSLRKPDAAAYTSDETATDLTAFNLMLAVQCASDLAAHLITDQDWEPAATSGNAFEPLAEHGVISAAIANQLRKAVGFRNTVAHGYAQLRTDLLHSAATSGLDDLVEFSREIANWLTLRAKLQ